VSGIRFLPQASADRSLWKIDWATAPILEDIQRVIDGEPPLAPFAVRPASPQAQRPGVFQVATVDHRVR